jgi:hypothetical protein
MDKKKNTASTISIQALLENNRGGSADGISGSLLILYRSIKKNEILDLGLISTASLEIIQDCSLPALQRDKNRRGD